MSKHIGTYLIRVEAHKKFTTSINILLYIICFFNNATSSNKRYIIVRYFTPKLKNLLSKDSVNTINILHAMQLFKCNQIGVLWETLRNLTKYVQLCIMKKYIKMICMAA